MLDYIKIQNQLRWLREQIECIKDSSCMCAHETDVLLSPGGVLTVIFTDGSTHSVTLPSNEGDGNIYTQSALYDVDSGVATFTRTDGSIYTMSLAYLKGQVSLAIDTANLAITRIDSLTGEVTTNTNNISILNTNLDNHLIDFNNPHQVTKEQLGLGNALLSGDNITELVNNAGYITIGQVPTAPVLTVAGKIGNVLIYKADITDFNESDYATAAQGLLANTALQPGDNISELANDVGYITTYNVTQNDVTQYQSALTITESQISDLQHVTNNNQLVNGANYITLAEVPPAPNVPVDSVNGKIGVVVLDKTDIGLSNVDNTSDLAKPISTATQTALDNKADTTDLGNYLPLTGGTLTGQLNANGKVVVDEGNGYSTTLSSNTLSFSRNGRNMFNTTDASGFFQWQSGGVDYLNAQMTLLPNGQLTLTEQLNANGGVVATQFVKSGGTSSQFLKADGSVDNNTYLTDGDVSGVYLPLSGGTITGQLNLTNDRLFVGTIGGAGISVYDRNIDFSEASDNQFNATSVGGYFIWRVNGNSTTESMRLGTDGSLTVSPSTTSDFIVKDLPFTSTASYMEKVITLFPVSETTTVQDNMIDGEIQVFKNGAIVYDNFTVKGGSMYNNTLMSLQSNGQRTDHKLVTFDYNGQKWFGVKLGYSANPQKYAQFRGFSKVFTNDEDKLKVIAYYNQNTSTVVNSEINSSIADWGNGNGNLETKIYQDVTIARDLNVSGDVVGNLTGNADTATKLNSIPTSFSGTYPVCFRINTGEIYAEDAITFNGTTNTLTTDVINGGSVSATNGFLKSTNSGATIQIGSSNTGFCHYITDAPKHYFNKPLEAVTSIGTYNTNNKITTTGVEADSVQNNGIKVKSHKIDAGTWNMDTTVSIDVAIDTYLTSITNDIRNVEVLVETGAIGNKTNTPLMASGYWKNSYNITIGSSTLTLTRTTSGLFDSSTYSSANIIVYFDEVL